MAGTGIAAGAVDLLHDDTGLGQGQARPAIFLRDQRRHPPRFCQRGHERFRIATLAVDLAVIFIRKFGADGTNAGADILEILSLVAHIRLLRPVRLPV